MTWSVRSLGRLESNSDMFGLSNQLKSKVKVVILTYQHRLGMNLAGSDVEYMRAKAAMAHLSSLTRSWQRISSPEYGSWQTVA